MDHLTDKPKELLDELAIDFKNKHRQKHKQNFPKISFASGFTNLSQIRASEWVGILYLMCILIQNRQGRDIINTALLKGGNEDVSDVLYVFEMILCFDAWLNKSSFWSTDNNTEYIELGQKSIKDMMKYIKKYLPETNRAQGWKNPKFHYYYITLT